MPFEGDGPQTPIEPMLRMQLTPPACNMEQALSFMHKDGTPHVQTVSPINSKMEK